MNFRQLSAFRALMSTGSATGAGELLGVSQPAISKTLKLMEDELGLKLFERVDGRLHPTPEARAILPEVTGVFRSVEAVRRAAAEMRSGGSGSVTVAAIHSLAHAFLPQTIERFHARWPSVTVVVDVLPTRQIIEIIGAGHADLGVVTDSADASFARHEDLLSSKVVCILPAGHELCSLPEIRPADLRGRKLACYGAQTPFGQRLARVFAAEGSPFTVQIQVATSTLLYRVVHDGLAIGLIEAFGVVDPKGPSVKVIPFQPTISIRLRAISPANRPRSIAAQNFMDEYRRVVIEADGAAAV